LINTSVTAPGATLALGLIYMKTNNKVVAGSLAVPDTHFLLEFVRPDFLGFRVISRALILWNEIEASKVWIEEQVPAVVRSAYLHMRSSAKSNFSMRSPAVNQRQDVEYDRRAIKQIYVHVMSAACFAIGLRYAGTGNLDAKEALMERVMELHSLREASDPVSVAIRPEIPILESCLGCVAISLAIVLAGTGDLDALRMFKILRWRCDNDSQYGVHMIIGMSIGLLFLGGGTCTLGREPADIAALVIAFFPRFPVSSGDNQYHLQALRHCYALAAKRMELRAIDVETKENVHVAVQISSSGSIEPLQFRVPCLLRNSESPLVELRVLSDRYYPLVLNLSRQNGICSFFVKRRYVQLTNTPSPSKERYRDNMVNVSSAVDPFLKAFSEYFCEEIAGKAQQVRDKASDPEFMTRVLSICQKNDAVDAMSLYCNLRRSVTDLKDCDSIVRTCFLWDLRLIQTYYERRKENLSKPLLDTQLLLPYLLNLANQNVATIVNSS
jgi:anaphase-promoting complex subunit 1